MPTGPSEPPEPQAPEYDDTLPVTLDAAQRREVQQVLREAGTLSGPVDGIFGPQTRSAIRAWQGAHEFDASGVLTELQLHRLLEGP